MDQADMGAVAAREDSASTVAALEALLKQPTGEAASGAETDTAARGETSAKEEAGGETLPGTGPAGRQVTGDEGQGGSDPESEPVIEAPRSWPAEARAAFAELPPDLRRVIRDRDAEQTAAFNRQVNEAADKRRSAEAEIAAASLERRQYQANLSAVIAELARQTAGEFGDIATPGDLERLAAQDPQRYLRWQARRDMLQAAQSEQARLAQQQRAEEERQIGSYLEEQRRLTLEKMPELADPAKARAIQAEATDYLKGLGFSEAEIGSVADHRLALVIRDALAHRKGQEAARQAATKKLANLPRLQKPGPGSEGKAEKTRQEKAALTRIARYGSTDQQAEALSRLLEGD